MAISNGGSSSGSDLGARQGGHSALKERLAEVQQTSSIGRSAAGGEARKPPSPGRGRVRGQPEAATVSPRTVIGLIAAAGVLIGLGLFFGLRSGNAVSGDASAAAGGSTGAAQAAAPVIVQKIPEEAIDDYYILLRQGMYSVAWKRTTDNFRTTNYPGGYDQYLKTWSGSQEIQVVSRRLIWSGDTSARVLANLHDMGTGERYTYAFSLVYDPATSMWKIDAIQSTW